LARKKLEFSEEDKKLISKVHSLILSKTDQQVTSLQFNKNTAILFNDKYDCEYFNLGEPVSVDVAEEELNKV